MSHQTNNGNLERVLEQVVGHSGRVDVWVMRPDIDRCAPRLAGLPCPKPTRSARRC